MTGKEAMQQIVDAMLEADWLGDKVLPKNGNIPFGWMSREYVYLFSPDVHRRVFPDQDYKQVLRVMEEEGYLIRGQRGYTQVRQHPSFGGCCVLIIPRQSFEIFFPK